MSLFHKDNKGLLPILIKQFQATRREWKNKTPTVETGHQSVKRGDCGKNLLLA